MLLSPNVATNAAMFLGHTIRRDASMELSYCFFVFILVAGAGFTQIPTLQKAV
jgi:hypothetical protein